MSKPAIIAAIVALAVAPATAQQNGKNMKDHGSQATHTENPYGPAEMDMHRKMMAVRGAAPDELWTRKMIEHHQGVIAMSRTALSEAPDAATRQMAQATADKQEQDVADLQAWLRKHNKQLQ